MRHKWSSKLIYGGENCYKVCGKIGIIGIIIPVYKGFSELLDGLAVLEEMGSCIECIEI